MSSEEIPTGTESVAGGEAVDMPSTEVEIVQEEETEPVQMGGEVDQEVAEEPGSNEEPKSEAKSDKFSSLMESLGDVPEDIQSKLFESIDETSLSNMTEQQKGLMQILWTQNKKSQEEMALKFEEREKALQAEREKISKERSDLIRSQAQYAEIFKNPALQDLLKSADVSEEEMAPADTPEGQQQRLEKLAADMFGKFHKPIVEAQQQVERRAAFQAFKDANPNMKDPNFQKKMNEIMKQRREAGNPVSWQDGHDLTENFFSKEAQQKQDRIQRKRRAESARQTTKVSSSSQPPKEDPIERIRKSGYKGYRGQQAINAWALDNPDKARKRLSGR